MIVTPTKRARAPGNRPAVSFKMCPPKGSSDSEIERSVYFSGNCLFQLYPEYRPKRCVLVPFPVVVTKYHDKVTLGDKRFIWHTFSSSLWGSQGSSNLKQQDRSQKRIHVDIFKQYKTQTQRTSQHSTGGLLTSINGIKVMPHRRDWRPT